MIKNKPEILAPKSTKFSHLPMNTPPPRSLVWLETSQNFKQIDDVKLSTHLWHDLVKIYELKHELHFQANKIKWRCCVFVAITSTALTHYSERQLSTSISHIRLHFCCENTAYLKNQKTLFFVLGYNLIWILSYAKVHKMVSCPFNICLKKKKFCRCCLTPTSTRSHTKFEKRSCGLCWHLYQWRQFLEALS